MRCALGCSDRIGISLHRFPQPHTFPEQFKAWVSVMGGKIEKPEDYMAYKHKRICHRHFTKEDYVRNNRLNALAVPSLHLPMWCNKPGVIVATSSAETLTIAEKATATVWCNKPGVIVATSSSETLACAGTSTGKVWCNKPGVIVATNSSEILTSAGTATGKGDIARHIVDSASSFVKAANLIEHEHDYYLKPQGIGEIPEPDLAAFATVSCGKDEHNYSTNSVVLIPRGNKTSRKMAPSYLMSKLKTNARQIKNLKREIIRLRNRGLNFKARLENAQKFRVNLALQTVTKNMTKPATIFTKMQFRQGSKKPKGRRFTTEEKILALSFYKRSSKCYSLLAKQFALPSKKTLKSLLSTIKLKTGINTIIFDKIKKTVATMNTDKKLCTIIFDEMSIDPQIHYDASKDTLKGFTDNGKTIADHVLVFMIKGITANFKQPVAYYFTNSLNKNELKSILIDVIKHVQATGLQVISTVCDQSTVNVSCINSLVEDTKSEYMRRGDDYRYTHFKIKGKIIIPLYDVPHLLKGIRNNLMTKDLIYKDEENNEKIVKWEYFEKLYAADKSHGELRVAHKLTEEHINKEKIKKMKVKTATQVFSHSVAVATEHLSARGDLPPECRDLIPLVLMFDKLFDSLNGNTFHIPNGKIYKGSVKRHSPHHVLWQKAIKLLKSMRFITKKKCAGTIQLVETTVPSVINFIKTIEGVQNIWKILNEKYSLDTLLTRNLNQDPVENFFGNIRSYGVRNVAPNCIAFEGAYKSLLLNNYNTPHSIQANCEEDNNDCLQTLDFFLTEQPSPNIPEQNNVNYVFNEEILTCSERFIPDKGQGAYVCGWVLTKCYKKIVKSCKICKQDLSSAGTNKNELIKEKEYNKKKKWLSYPSEKITKIFQEIQNITCTFLKKDVPKYNLKANIKMMCDTLINYQFSCNVHKVQLQSYFVDTTIKVLIYSWCRSINRILSGKISYDLGEHNELKLVAHNYYTKHKHNKNRK